MKKFEYEKGITFLRDSFVPFSDAKLNIASSSVLYGLSIYTVFSLNWNKEQKKLYAFRLKDHFNRLVSSSKIMDFHSFEENWNYEKFENMIFSLVRKNNIKEDALVRVSVFIDANCAGTKIHSLPNSLSAYIYPMGEILPRSGIHVCVSSWRRNPDNAIPSRAKVNGGYANVALMKNEALLNGYDDAIALDENGYVTEGTVANLFLVKKDKLITASANSDILEGITRDCIIKLAEDEEIEVIERPIARSELYTAEEVFITGSSARLTPILSIDRREVGKGKIGLITAKLAKIYEEIQRGISKGHKEWRTAL